MRDHQEGANDDGIVMAIIGMGHGLKLRIIAEGVETQAQADFLKLKGCDEIQGYFYSKPLPPDLLENYLSNEGLFTKSQAVRNPIADARRLMEIHE